MRLEPLDVGAVFGYGPGIHVRRPDLRPTRSISEGPPERVERVSRDVAAPEGLPMGKGERAVRATPRGILKKRDVVPVRRQTEGGRFGTVVGFSREVSREVWRKAWRFGRKGRIEKKVKTRTGLVTGLMGRQWATAGSAIRVSGVCGGGGKGFIGGGAAADSKNSEEKERKLNEVWEKEMKEKLPELVELFEQNAEFKKKIKIKHGVRMAEMVEAECRKRERDRKILEVERDLERLQVKGEIGKGGEGMSARLKGVLGIEDEDEGEEGETAPTGVDHFDVVYWEEDERGHGLRDERRDEQAMEERKRKVTVVDEGSAYSALTESAVRRLKRIMGNWRFASGRQLANINGCIITEEDLIRLRPGVWLNDEIVNAYLELVAKRMDEVRGEGKNGFKENGRKGAKLPKLKMMNSFFYSRLVSYNRAQQCSVYDYTRVRRWTRRFDAFSYDMLIIPINQQNTHWTLGVVNFRDKCVMHLDSLGSGGSAKVRENLMRWVKDEAADKKKGEVFEESEWKMVARPDVPQQGNSDDCGVFTCKFADFLARGWERFSFDQRHMNYFRSRIAHELLMDRAT